MSLTITSDGNALQAIRNAGMLVSLVVTLAGCATQGGYVPPEALAKPGGEFSKSVATFAEAVQKDQLSTYRREVRLDYVLSAVRDVSETNNWDAKTLQTALESLSTQAFLCLPRYAAQRVSSRITYVGAVGTVLANREEASSDELGPLLQSLGVDYTIVVSPKDVPPTYDAWLQSDPGKQCADRVVQGDPFATRTWVGNEFAFAAVPAGISLIDTIWGIIKPVVVGTIKIVDLERRNAAIRAYFSDQRNVDTLKLQLEKTEAYLVNEFQLAQIRTAGEAAASVNSLLDPRGAHWKVVQTNLGTTDCRTGTASLRTNKASPIGVQCLHAAREQISKQLVKALDDADAFDLAMERQLPNAPDRLSAQVSTLSDIATGKQAPEEKVRALWAAGLRYVALYQTVETAGSTENRKKIQDAWAAFQKSLK